MSLAIITGSAGLIGAEATRFFAKKGLDIIGIDNDMRQTFFGEGASTKWQRTALESSLKNYKHIEEDIRDRNKMESLFKRVGREVKLVIHTAAQPSHDWASTDPHTDFSVNANGTLTLLECVRQFCPDATFIFCSTNKVYGDTPNRLPLIETDMRWELPASHSFGEFGIDESMSIDATVHSLFGVSKVSADLMVQEYGKYFGIKTVCFRGGCLTGPGHSGAPLHGFLAYLVQCAVTGKPYSVLGYKGKQVRDNIHSYDLITAFWYFFQQPRSAEIYNIGGSRFANCSILEAIKITEGITGRPMNLSFSEYNRIGDHIWWISDIRKFQKHYPEWRLTKDLHTTIAEINDAISGRLP